MMDSQQLESREYRPEGRSSAIAGGLLLALALLYAGWMMAHHFDGPFQRGFLGQNGARYSLQAKNFLRLDPGPGLYTPLLNTAGMEGPNPDLHHPPLLHWLVAFSFSVLGESENHARLVPYLFTLLNVILLFLLGRRLLGSTLAGGLSALLFALLPFTPYYGVHVDVQSGPLLFFILSAILCDFLWIDSGRRRWRVLSLAAFLAGLFCGWFTLYLCVLLPLHHWMVTKGEGGSLRDSLKKYRACMGLGLVVFTSLLIWYSAAPLPVVGINLFEALANRVLDPVGYFESGDPWSFYMDALRYYCLPSLHALYPWPFWLVMALGLLLGKKSSPTLKAGLWLFFLLGASHLVLFPVGGVLLQDFWSFLCPPWVALCSALALVRLMERIGIGTEQSGSGRENNESSREQRGSRSRPGLNGYGLAGALVCLMAWVSYGHSVERLNLEADLRPHELGCLVNRLTEPHEAILTNEFYNPPIEGKPGRYVFSSPVFTYYADRVMYGNIQTPEELAALLAEKGNCAYFLFIRQYYFRNRPLYDYLQARGTEVHTSQDLVFFKIR